MLVRVDLNNFVGPKLIYENNDSINFLNMSKLSLTAAIRN